VQVHTARPQVAPGSLVHVQIGCLDTLDEGRRKRVSRQRSRILLAYIVELVRVVHGSSLVRQKREPRAPAAAREGNRGRTRPSKKSPHWPRMFTQSSVDVDREAPDHVEKE